MPLTTFLFDLDGTIIDSIELILRSYRHTMQLHRCNEPMPPDDMWIKGLGTPLWTQFGEITSDKEEIEAMVQTYRTYNLTHLRAAADVLRGRQVAAGVRALVVPGSMQVKAAAEAEGLDEVFDIIVGCDDVKNFKPHPEPVLKAVEELGAPHAETVFVGDSRHDMECGRAAGVKTAAVLWGPFDRAHLKDLSPDYWLEKPEDLRQLYDL